MKHTLTVNIHIKTISKNDLEEVLLNVFKRELIFQELPFNSKVENLIKDSYGEMVIYKTIISEKNFEKAVFTLLLILEEFGINWRIRKPTKMLSEKYVFIASLYPEFGIITLKGINGISVILEEGE